MAKSKYNITAYYFPNWHIDARNEEWYGKGWTEWELVKNAKPRFEGHQQPKVSEWGYFDESKPEWAAKEINLATSHGISTFIFDWYWYDGKPYLHEALENGFLKAPNNTDMKFALMWANHTWIHIHPFNKDMIQKVLARGEVSGDRWLSLIDYVIEKYFHKENYLKIEGEGGGLYFSIYDLGTFITGMGGLEKARDALNLFRKKVEEAGLGRLHLNAVVYSLQILPTEIKLENPNDVIKILGFDSTTTYAWVHHYAPDTHGFPRGSYAEAMKANVSAWYRYREELPVPYHPNISVGWDPSPRAEQGAPYENKGITWTAILDGNTPEAFRLALEKAKTFMDGLPDEQKILTIYAWNEWTESSYLLPDTRYSTRYLEAIRDVFK